MSMETATLIIPARPSPDPPMHAVVCSIFLATGLACFGEAVSPQPAGLKRKYQVPDDGRIRPYETNPFFWQYLGQPVLLLGGSDDDNLFQWDEAALRGQLDSLVAAGGNYVRNTMSARDAGNVQPFGLATGGGYDLETWNPGYWERFERFLRMTAERGIIVQIEIWDPWDAYGEQWQQSPWNPAHNINYPTGTTRLATAYEPPQYRDGLPHGKPHDFFLTPPDLGNDRIVLAYQQRFVEAILARTLPHPHVLYCITNEIHPHYPPQWGWYWAGFIRERARAAELPVYITEMYWSPDFRHPQHRASLDRPDIYDFFEASQNSATADAESHWRNQQHARQCLVARPRPINHTKTYGADGAEPWAGSSRHAHERFWRSLLGGAASVRFHRPPYGLGLGGTARSHLKSARMLEKEFDFFRAAPDAGHRLLGHGWFSKRSENEAYLSSVAGVRHAVYFPDGGKVGLDLREAAGPFTLQWLNIAECRWIRGGSVEGAGWITLKSPGKGPWVALLKPRSPSPSK
jgi:hypothetical protein